MTPSVSYRSDLPTRAHLPRVTRTATRKERRLPHGAGFVLALPLSMALWVGLLVWWLT